MATDRLIYVLGTPSGGTSAVAGMLHHLGVDMGDITYNGPRPYQVYEDRSISAYTLTYKARGSMLLRQRCNFRRYANERLQAAEGRRVGVKCSALYWVDDPDPDSLPIDAILVHRPVEHSITSDRKTWERIFEREPDRPGAKYAANPRYWIERASGIGGAWAAKEALSYQHHSLVRAQLDYYLLLSQPRGAAIHLMNALSLKPTDDQLRAAIAFIDPTMRNV